LAVLIFSTYTAQHLIENSFNRDIDIDMHTIHTSTVHTHPSTHTSQVIIARHS